MGKPKPKMEVTEYYMSVHFGICSGPVDALLGVTIKEKTAWTGSQTEPGGFAVSNKALFGGVKKEGGVDGLVTYLPGRSDQVLPDFHAARLGRGTGANCPGYRGIASLFFTGKGNGSAGGFGTSSMSIFGTVITTLTKIAASYPGFYWTANSPYLPGVWATVRRKPVGLNPAYAMIYRGSRTPRAICFALDRSGSMAGERLDTLKTAMATVFDMIEANVVEGVQLDLAVIPFDNGTQTRIRRDADVSDVEYLDSIVQGMDPGAGTHFGNAMEQAEMFFDGTDPAITERFLFFVTDGLSTGGLATAAAISESLSDVDIHAINIVLTDTSETAQIDNTPSDGVPVVSGSDPSGLIDAVTTALFPDSLQGDANPAHMIYECLSNTDWGMGAPSTIIDIDSFNTAALTLFGEVFGLSMIWTRQAAVEDFISEILDHIQAVLFVDPATGLLTLKLIRDDYDPDTLPVLTPDNADVMKFDRKLWGEIINEIIVTWTNPENEQDETVSAQDLASIAMQGGNVVSASRNYYGVRHAGLATQLGRRDLRTVGAPLCSCEVEIDRSAYALRPASVVKLTWPEHGLDGVIMRVMSIDYGRPGDMTIRATLMEDVFSLDAGAYVDPPATGWEDPSSEPEPITEARVITLPTFLAAEAIATNGGSDPVYPEVVAGILATTSNTDTFAYSLQSELSLPDGSLQWTALGDNNIIGRGAIAADMVAEAATTGVTVTDFTGQTVPTQGGFALIGDSADDETAMEVVMVTAFDSGTGEFSLARGVMDTVPRAWATGTHIWFVDGETLFEDRQVRSAGETVEYKLLSQTSQGQLALSAAPLLTGTMTERPWLPLRPANVTVYGEAWSGESDMIDARDRLDPWVTVTWSNRNRLTEDSQILLWTDATVTPEAGQTTTIEVVALDDTVLETHDGLSGTGFDVPDSSFGGEAIVKLRISAERDGFASLQAFEHWIQVAPLTFDTTRVTFDSDTWTMDQD